MGKKLSGAAARTGIKNEQEIKKYIKNGRMGMYSQ